MQARGGMLLNDEAKVFGGAGGFGAARLLGLREVALGLIEGEFVFCHVSIPWCSHPTAARLRRSR